jgi:hypothetical protein
MHVWVTLDFDFMFALDELRKKIEKIIRKFWMTHTL